jgi:hypothetical protein
MNAEYIRQNKRQASLRERSVEPQVTTTVKEELAEVVDSCLGALAQQTKFEQSLYSDLKSVEKSIRWFNNRRGNEPVTVEVGTEIAEHVRRAIEAIHLSAQGVHIVLLLLLKVSLLAQQETSMNTEALTEAKKDLESWFEQWTSTKGAWDQYTE